MAAAVWEGARAAATERQAAGDSWCPLTRHYVALLRQLAAHPRCRAALAAAPEAVGAVVVLTAPATLWWLGHCEGQPLAGSPEGDAGVDLRSHLTEAIAGLCTPSRPTKEPIRCTRSLLLGILVGAHNVGNRRFGRSCPCTVLYNTPVKRKHSWDFQLEKNE
eukprot:64451-Prorocentrum_minimum.AAC.1